MKKRYCFLVFIAALFVLLTNNNVYAQDGYRGIKPMISEEDLEDILAIPCTSGFDKILLAQNDHSLKLDDDSQEELEDDFLDDFENQEQSQSVADPLYYFNYAMYSFNDVLYFGVLKPLASGYKAITPTIIRKGVNNFFHNLLFPVRFVNNFLQWKVKEAGTEVGIFLINSTIGIVGFGQVAQNEFDLYTSNEDLGQTLGSYFIGNGFYLVLPILGPSSLRDTIGLAGDHFLTPVNYVEPWALSFGIKTYDSINSVSFRLGDYEALKKAAFDPYIALKDAYIQNRNEKIRK